jgi:rfaE bifunctional protein kinase chain/domain
MHLDFREAQVLVVGDVMLDRYWFGDSTRISPEAPVPVVQVESIHEVAGGAANVAINNVNLGGRTTLLSVVGNDQEGHILETLLTHSKVHCVLHCEQSLRTTVKVRLIARHQQIVRADFEQRLDHEVLLPLLDLFYEQVMTSNVVIFSDYGKGGLAHIRLMIEHAQKADITILVDPKGSDYSAYHGATVITPNKDEFAMVVGRWSDEADFERRGFALRDHLGLEALLVTRSEEGMSLFLGSRHVHISAHVHQVFDVSGAGDTVIATMAAAIGSGFDIESAARVANTAAGIVVGKVGTTPITLGELQKYV